MAILIDTSVIVAAVTVAAVTVAAERGRLPIERALQVDQQYSVSAVTAGELLHGVHRATGRRAQPRSAFVEGLLAAFEPIPIDLVVARAYSRVSADLARRGTPIDANDLWIGATAIAHDLDVLALDGDFDRIPGVRCARVPAP